MERRRQPRAGGRPISVPPAEDRQVDPQIEERAERIGPVRLRLLDGEEIEVYPLSIALYQAIERRYEIPDPPMRTVESLTGPEEEPDPQNPEYQQRLGEITKAQAKAILRAIVMQCLPGLAVPDDNGWIENIQMIMPDYEPPEDPIARKIDYLELWKIRTTREWEMIRTAATSSWSLNPAEVELALKRFRYQISRQVGDIIDTAFDEAFELDVSGTEAGGPMALDELGEMADLEP